MRKDQNVPSTHYKFLGRHYLIFMHRTYRILKNRRVKAHLYVADDRIGIRRTTNCLIFLKKNIYRYKFNFGTCTVQTMQKDFGSTIFCLLCCMHWYSWDIIRSSLRIRTHSLRIHTVVKFYNHMLQLRMHSDAVSSSTGAHLMKTVIKNNCQ